MKRKLGAALAVLFLLALAGCKSTAARWQEQYDLGMRYLSDGDYEEAILAFNAAIEIDPTQADAYLNLANAYIGMNDFDAAREVLEQGYELTGSQVLKDKLDELDSGNIYDFWGNARKISGYDGTGNLQWYHIYEYNGRQQTSITVYDAADTKIGFWDGFRYDEQGRQTCGVSWSLEDGMIVGSVENTYDENDHLIRGEHYLLDGTMSGYNTYTCDDQGRTISTQYYNPSGELIAWSEEYYDGDVRLKYKNYRADGTLEFTVEFHYDENGTYTGETMYDPDGNVLFEQTAGN